MATEDPIASELVGGMEAERNTPLEERLRRHVQEHVDAEHAILREYEALAERIDNPAIRYLITMIMEDELRHHRWMSDLAATLSADLAWGHHPDGVPHVDGISEHSENSEVLAATERMVAVEEDDLRELTTLRKDLAGMEGTTIWPAVIDAMTADTRKHIALMNTVRELVTPE